MKTVFVSTGCLLLLLLLDPGALAGQGPGPGSGTLRAHWHVFIAYAVAWILVFAWILHIGRRLSRAERLAEGRDGGS